MVCHCSSVTDDVVLQVVQLMLRLSSLSAAVQTTTDQLLLVSASVSSLSLYPFTARSYNVRKKNTNTQRLRRRNSICTNR